jgi:hypothetical protein
MAVTGLVLALGRGRTLLVARGRGISASCQLRMVMGARLDSGRISNLDWGVWTSTESRSRRGANGMAADLQGCVWVRRGGHLGGCEHCS